MAMIKDYVVIDHIGMIEDDVVRKKLYNTAYKLAAEAGYKGKNAVWTTKRICQAVSPYAKEQTDKQKNYIRCNKHPKQVYLICDSIDNDKVNTAIWLWETKAFVPVKIISAEEGVIEDPSELVYGMKISRARRCAAIWGKALGWSFSAPLFRDNTPRNIDMQCARPSDSEESGSYAAVRYTNEENFVKFNVAVAPEAECEAFFEHYAYYQQTGSLEFALDPGYKICPKCGRPVHESAETCDYCDTIFEAITWETFWDDSYDDTDEFNYEPPAASASIPSFNIDIDIDTVDFATREYKKYLADCMIRDSGKFYFPEANNRLGA